MHVFQRTKASITFLRKTRVTKLFLVFACLLLCSMALSLFLSTGTARAASLGAKSANIPATSGGGCGVDRTNSIAGCISENSSKQVVPDAYILANNVCDVVIEAEDVNTGGIVTSRNYGNVCFTAGSHLFGFSFSPGGSPHTWNTLVFANLGGEVFVASPDLNTP